MKHTFTPGGHTEFRYFRVSPHDRLWGLYLTTAGKSRVAPWQQYPPAGHPGSYQFDWAHGRTLSEYQLIYISGGSGSLETRGNRYSLEAGCAFLLHPGMWHRYRPDDDVGWEEHWLGFDGPAARQLVRNGFFLRKDPYVRVRNEGTVLQAFGNIMEAMRANCPALQQVIAGTALYILSLLYSSAQPVQDISGGGSSAVEQALRQIEDSAGKHLDLQDLASSLHVSYSYFRRCFRQHTGLSPHQYRLHLKMASAGALLRDTKLSVKETAFRSGFQSEHYFCRFFKKHTGQTPTEYRVLSAAGRNKSSVKAYPVLPRQNP